MENNKEIHQDNNSFINFSLPSKVFAYLNSYLFHPLFVPLYVILFLLYVHPSAFTGFSDSTKIRVIFIVIINLLFFPLISVLLLKAVGFIDSIYLKNQKDRIIPYIASGIFFFWAYHVFKEQSQYPEVWVSYLLGLFLASSAALIANIYFKVSMHAVGVGGWLGLFFLMFNSKEMMMTWPLAAVLLITGMVCTSRMILKAHSPLDIYGGLIIGVLTQLAGWYF
jgi:membrane-associated phospholipid phosphatase